MNKGTYKAALFVEQNGELRKEAEKTVKLTGKERELHYFDTLCKEMAEENLHIKVKRTGVVHCYIGSGMCSTFRKVGGTEYRYGECIMEPLSQNLADDYPVDFGSESTPEFDEDGQIYVTHIGVELYPIGYVIKTGDTVYGVFGNGSDGYLSSISTRGGRTHMKSGNKSAAKIFEKPQSIVKFLEKYKDDLMWFAGNSGKHFSVEAACKLAGTEEIKDDDNIKHLLDEINAGTETETKEDVLLGEDSEEEALLRMRELGIIGEARSRFRRGELMQSEFGGILYDLDKNAQTAVEMTKQYGTPYHVIKTGPMYSVLYVSNHAEEWSSDRYRPSDPYIYANVYNEELGYDEIGMIGVKPVNGGLIRTA